MNFNKHPTKLKKKNRNLKKSQENAERIPT